MVRLLARSIVVRYPRPWRERYEGEVLALLEQSPAGWRDVLELTRGWLVEHLYRLFTDDERPARTQWLIHLSWPAALTVLLGSAWLSGLGLRWAVGPWPPSLPDSRAPFLALLLMLVIWDIVQGLGTRRFPRPRQPAWLAIVGLGVCFTSVAILAWAEVWPTGRRALTNVDPFRTFMNLYVLWLVPSSLLETVWPGERLIEGLGRVEVAEQELALSRKWVAGCHEMIGKGVATPLADAEAAVVRWTNELTEARQQLAALGYRSRFLPQGATPSAT